jgi:hypothetical protein
MSGGVNPGERLCFIDGIGHEIYVDKADESFNERDSFLVSIKRE